MAHRTRVLTQMAQDLMRVCEQRQLAVSRSPGCKAVAVLQQYARHAKSLGVLDFPRLLSNPGWGIDQLIQFCIRASLSRSCIVHGEDQTASWLCMQPASRTFQIKGTGDLTAGLLQSIGTGACLLQGRQAVLGLTVTLHFAVKAHNNQEWGPAAHTQLGSNWGCRKCAVC